MSNVIDMSKAREKKAAKDFGERQILDKEAVNRALFAGQYYLNCEQDGVSISVKFGPGDYKKAALVTNANAYVEFFEKDMARFGLKEDDVMILCGSSMDFPEEYTDRDDVKLLCDQIRQS